MSGVPIEAAEKGARVLGGLPAFLIAMLFAGMTLAGSIYVLTTFADKLEKGMMAQAMAMDRLADKIAENNKLIERFMDRIGR